MKSTALTIICLALLSGVHAQYYYKDLLIPEQAKQQLQKYKEQKVRSVKLQSFESDGQPTENFQGNQSVDQNFTRITTSLQTVLAGASQLISSFNNSGRLIKTIDTTEGSGSTTEYFFNEKNDLSKVINVSSSAGPHREKEEHIWNYKDNKPSEMYRIKNNTDTTYIKFVLDEKGNVAEENSMRNGAALPSFYYYYDDQNRLTDIVSYNIKAKRLLPDYVFEYNENGAVKTMLVVPEGSSDYQKWYYEYKNGLKTKETVYNKKKQLLGRIEYSYE